MLKNVLAILFFLHEFNCDAQFAPQAGLPGSTAMYKDSSAFIAWASDCTINRGWMDIADTTLGKVTLGNFLSATGKANGDIICLGDGGEAIYYFENPVIDLQGPDFAIFENGFINPVDSNFAYLELAKVSVSNDGIVWHNFKTVCNNDTSIQLGGFGDYMDARNVFNLAGKYIADYGTPFDLSELSASGGLDVNHIRYIKITDVVGSINDTFCVRDHNQHKINEPYPTPFPSGGFDLDALGIIHQKYPTSLDENNVEHKVTIYPNPGNGIFYFRQTDQIVSYSVYSISGALVIAGNTHASNEINLSSSKDGIYFISILHINGLRSNQLITKHEKL